MKVNDRVEFLEYKNKCKKGTIIKFLSKNGAEDDVPTIANVKNLKVI